MNRSWKPNVTVAAIVERDGKFLVVEESTADGNRFNQPAGHLERGESLLDAVKREVLEETGYHFEPAGLVGIYMADKENSDITYLRFAFHGSVSKHETDRPLDTGIIAAHWQSADTILASGHLHRSPLMIKCLQDYLAGQRADLSLLYRHED